MNNKAFKELIIFFIVTIVITWILWLPSVLNSNGYEVPIIFLIISMMASFTPSVTGLVLNRKFYGRVEFRQDVRNKLSIHFNKKWLLIIGLIFPAIAGISYQLVNWIDPTYETVMKLSPVMIPLVFLQILFVGGAIGEEFGWRGFAYSRLKMVVTPFYATLILGILWSVWHLPLFFMDGTVQSNIPIWQFLLQNTLIAYFYSWVYEQTKGNLILMIYLHAVANTASAVFPYWQSNNGRYIGFGVLLISWIFIRKIKLKQNHLPDLY